MRSARQLGGALALAFLFGGGCGAEEETTVGPPPPIDGEEEVKAAWCEALVRCDMYPDVESCVAAIDVVGSDLRDAFESGKLVFDPDAAADCEAALADATCEELTSAPDLEACTGVWDGTVPVGDECATSAECAEGVCDAGDCDPALSCCAGLCASDDQAEQEAAIGGDCSIEPCVAEGYCDYEAVPATCRALVGVDLPCSEGTCGAGLYCRISEPELGTGLCSDLPGEGEGCDPDYPVCARGDNWCDPADSTCRKLAAVGDPCDEMSDNCVAYAWCSPDGVCVALPAQGEPCLDWPPCLGDLECVDDTCVIPPLEEDCE